MSPEAEQDLVAEPDPAGAFAPASPGGSRESSREVLAFKFGGSSLLGAERMLHAASLVREAASDARVSGFVLTNPEPKNVVVVVSAMKGVTDRLLGIAASVEAGRAADARRESDHVFHLHFDVLRELRLDPLAAERVVRELRLLGKDLLHDVSQAVHSSAETRAALHDRLASYGERFSARLFTAALQKSGVSAVPVSSSEFVLTCDTFRDAQPHIEETRRRGRDILLPLFADGLVPVVTGFIGATQDGRVTTLGRNSSDFSGALVAHVVDADELVIWTDVDGIYTANPHESAEAQLLHELSYEEAHALAASGAKVLHAKVLPLAAETEMVVWVRNTFNPRFRGTRIGPPAPDGADAAVSAGGGVLPHDAAAPVPALPHTCHSERSESASADERSRGISLESGASGYSAPFSSDSYNSNPRGEA